MKRTKDVLKIALTLFIIIVLSACGKTNYSKVQKPVKNQVALTVSAAVSLKDAMEDIKRAYKNENPNVDVVYNFGSSGTLQKQIEQGADVDIFISAAPNQMDALKDKGLIVEDTRRDLLGNKIVLVVPVDSSGVSDFKDLTSDKVKKIAIGEPKSVPVGQYAEEALTNMKLMDSIKSKMVYARDAKEVITWIETGNVDAGVVYETDAKISTKVNIVSEVPEGYCKSVVYPAAVVKASKNMDAARGFINYLYSSKAKPVFEKYGFVFLAK